MTKSDSDTPKRRSSRCPRRRAAWTVEGEGETVEAAEAGRSSERRARHTPSAIACQLPSGWNSMKLCTPGGPVSRRQSVKHTGGMPALQRVELDDAVHAWRSGQPTTISQT
eukprot:519956-Prorocentrum_minimum.AAC.1